MANAKPGKLMPFEKPKISTLPPEKIAAVPEVAETIVHRDPKANATITYRKGKFLGKGGFAKCYELIESTSEKIVAGKIVPKALLTKSHQRDKMAQEIAIHRELCHVNIVKFLSFFDDEHFVYVTLELCRKRSMMELHKRRKALTEPEVRFYMKQIVNACCYLHDNRIIHRDLKLGNLFLNDDFQVKIGDFGLATRVEIDGERKKTLCGTPNYIAPEVLCKKGHSYEVDVWSLGCILYTLLVGKPPFETSSLKETYSRIKKNEYYIPSKVAQPAQMLIIKTLRPEPSSRPTMHEISDDKFLTSGFTPSTLPNSSLTMAPRFNSGSGFDMRRPLTEVNSNECSRPSILQSIPEIGKVPDKANQSRAVFVHNGQGRDCDEDPEQENIEGSSNDFYLSDMLSMLAKVVESNPSEKGHVNMDDAEDPALTPVVWVSKWVDYSDKYGLGYQLCDGSVGVSFNDATRLLMHEDGKSLEYIDKAGSETFFQLDSAPEALHKKKTLLEYFHHYMTEHLLKTGAHIEPPKGLDVARLPFLRVWFRTRSAIILHLNVGILQINFFTDHTKVIICPKMEAVSYIDEHRNFRTYKLELIQKHGCSRELFVRLRYAKTMVERLMKKLEEDCVRKPQS